MRSTDYLIASLTPVLEALGHAYPSNATVEPPKDKKFGDLASNCALVLAKSAGKNPRELAQAIADGLRAAPSDIADISIAGPGFLNVTFKPSFWQHNISIIEQHGNSYGASNIGEQQKIQVEFVSANPTGPLHIGHGRGAALGDSLARILRFAGYTVSTEYYINDAGLQMHTLGRSIWLRMLELKGKDSAPFPEDCYKGDYVIDIARALLGVEPSLTSGPAPEGMHRCYEFGMQIVLEGIKEDLANFRVHHDVWFSELTLTSAGKVEATLASLLEKGIAFEQDGALWFRTTTYGDDKDRVLKKSDGALTYFASDIAYHDDKYNRGFTKVIDIWGADHHGYIARMRAAVSALGHPQEAFDVMLVQLVNLLRNGEQIAMSTRAGQFETLADVVSEVGVDAARFIFLSRKSDSKLDFDLNIVKQRTMENPVYYVQYAHARVCTMTRRATEQGLTDVADADISLLVAPGELDLLRTLDRFPQVAREAAASLSPHFISYYLLELAGLLHKYYAAYPVLKADEVQLAQARLRLLQAAAQTIRNGLDLLGVTSPENM